jgi:hypothetical protein
MVRKEAPLPGTPPTLRSQDCDRGSTTKTDSSEQQKDGLPSQGISLFYSWRYMNCFLAAGPVQLKEKGVVVPLASCDRNTAGVDEHTIVHVVVLKAFFFIVKRAWLPWVGTAWPHPPSG